MSVSLEALAMAGEDYGDFGINMVEWERAHLEDVPAHLLADEDHDHQYHDQQRLCSDYVDNHVINIGNHAYFEAYQDQDDHDCEASTAHGHISLRGLVMIITAIIRLTMLMK
ncbi:uncharacterized protein LOC130820143 [Amaranthus tricolor]|uniref:uncharacterized protein LOC130820143 n=1 Tax=Amaranthus tricolor TaxID=29722 RepID=UPI002588432D|nr:uncharacterized protein LOC130820143 [Amaranthus tricolor]